MTDPETEETYRTLATVGESAFEVRGSEFFGYAAPARDVEAAEAVIEERRARYDDASHNVPAYRVRVGRRAEAPGADVLLREYSSDDGEPTSSAGKPALNVLQGRELENVVAVVTRYYGGTNLGIGGLVRSYSRAVNDAVEDAETTTERPHDSIRAVVDYDDSGTVRTVLESAELSFEAEYAERVAFDVRVPVADAAALVERLRSATGGRVELE